ncbi:NTP transferase domain-containing protein, partial [Mycobacterium avium]|uniref:NTP transferase domain-containing protein n=1 Tax=Mycobacterium avium TaxID=1764 RepID=UPI001F3E820A
AAAEAGARYAFVCAVDMPLLSPELIDDLVHLATETKAEVVLPWDGRSHYLASLYRTDLAERIDRLVAGSGPWPRISSRMMRAVTSGNGCP